MWARAGALRVAGEIGAPLQAELDVYCTAAQFARLRAFGDELRFLMITSAARVHQVSAAPADAVAAESVPGGGVWIRVQASKASKCVRCWHHREDVGQSSEHPELCLRCVGNISGAGETRRYV
jgi:isoleucyl-tRNA synthetase